MKVFFFFFFESCKIRIKGGENNTGRKMED